MEPARQSRSQRGARCVLCVAPVLPQDVRNQTKALSELGLLDNLVSSVAYSEGGRIDSSLRFLDRAFGTRIIRATEHRRLNSIPQEALRSRPWPELWTRLGCRLGLLAPGPKATDRYLAQLDRAAARRVHTGIKLVIGREDSCLATFRMAKRMGAFRLYDLPTTYYRKVRAIMEREVSEFPNAALQDNWQDEYSTARNQRKDNELAAADHVLVPSRFVRESLIEAGISSSHVTVIPFGCQPESPDSLPAKPSQGKKVILYAGNLSVRKGTPRLLRAWKRLGAYRTHTLRLIGSLHLNANFFADYAGLVEYIPRLPRSELRVHYATSYMFVMPAAAEGFAVVITEALSHGLPVIASENSGAGGFITHGKEGLLYPFVDDEKLCSALDHVLSRPAEVAPMSQAALELAQRWTWQHYRDAFKHLILTLLSERNDLP